MLIRPATPADVPAVLEIERSCPSAAHWAEQEYGHVFEQSSVSRKLLVAEAGRVKGFLVARVVAGEWELENIAVGPESQGRGVGSALLEGLLEMVRAAHGVRLMLEVRESNDLARKLYENKGLRVSGQRRAYYQNPTEDAILYDILV